MTDRNAGAPRAAARFLSVAGESGSLRLGPAPAGIGRRTVLRGGAGLAAVLALSPLVTVLGLLPRGARAQDATQSKALAITPEVEADLVRIEDYLNSITTLTAKFQQYSEGGGVVFGDIYVRRPGRMRVEYAPPVPVILVADGIAVSYYDSELDQLSQLPISATPVWFLLRETVSLRDKDITLTALDKRPGALRLSMYQTSSPEEGSVELVFADDPLELRQWKITDAAGKEARIGLFDVRLGSDLPNELFATPRRRRRTGNN